jgi:hypothetical protein
MTPADAIFKTFFKELKYGNLKRAFNSFFNSASGSSAFNRKDWADASNVFMDIVGRKAFHSASVCRAIRDNFIEYNMLTVQQIEKMRAFDIPEPDHPGILLPCVNENGDGMLVYAAAAALKDRILGNPKRYIQLEPKQNFTDQVGQIASKLLRDYCIDSALDDQPVVFYQLNTDPIPDNPLPEINCWLSGSLSAAIAIISGFSEADTQMIDIQWPRVATGVFEDNRFKLPEKVPIKLQLVADEISEAECILVGSGNTRASLPNPPTVKTIADIDECIHLFSGICQNQKMTDWRFEHLTDTCERIKNPVHRLRHILGVDKLWNLSARPIPDDMDEKEAMSNFFLMCFDTARHTFHFDIALQYKNRLETLFENDAPYFDNKINPFFGNCVSLYTALYNFKEANKYIRRTKLLDLDGDDRQLYSCIFAETCLLADNTTEAKKRLEKMMTETVNGPAHMRCQIYLLRLEMNQNRAVDNRILSKIDDLQNTKCRKSDRPYMFYVKIRALFLSGRYNDAVNEMQNAENDVSIYKNRIWPGLLWRRYGGLSAEKCGDLNRAEEYLTAPLPDEYADSFILNAHRAASCLLWWSMNYSPAAPNTAGDLHAILEPLTHPLIHHWFEQAINALTAAVASGQPPDTVRTCVNDIVRLSYE